MYSNAQGPREEMSPLFSIRSAIARRQLLLHYQPIVDLRTGGVFAVEALVRWRHPAYGVLLPSKFMPAIETPEDHRLLDLWVLETASRQIQQLDRAFRTPLLLSLNVSPQHIGDPASITQFAQLIQNRVLEPSRLILELTENAALRDTQQAVRAIAHLKSLGVRFAIDDFGTGFATLDYLARLPADFLKVDRSFIGHYGDEKHGAIIKAVLDLAQQLGISVIMEGIEREDQLTFAQTHDAPYGQGFLFAPALDPLELTAMMQRTPPRHQDAVS